MSLLKNILNRLTSSKKRLNSSNLELTFMHADHYEDGSPRYERQYIVALFELGSSTLNPKGFNVQFESTKDGEIMRGGTFQLITEAYFQNGEKMYDYKLKLQHLDPFIDKLYVKVTDENGCADEVMISRDELFNTAFISVNP